MGDELAQRADAVGAARDVRMQADVHDPATGRPFRIEDVEFLDQRLRELVGGEILARDEGRSEEHTSELQSLMRISYAVFCLKKKKREKIKDQKQSHK